MINQLFYNKPTIELINKMINILGFENLYTNKKIFKNDLKNKNIIVKFNEIIYDVTDNYLDCKKQFCNNLNEKKCVTITRQHLKTINQDILSEIVYIDGRRHITYRIVHANVKKNIKKGLEFNICFS